MDAVLIVVALATAEGIAFGFGYFFGFIRGRKSVP